MCPGYVWKVSASVRDWKKPNPATYWTVLSSRSFVPVLYRICLLALKLGRGFVAYVRMMGVQRGALQSTVEDVADDIDKMCDQAGVPRRTGEPSTD